MLLSPATRTPQISKDARCVSANRVSAAKFAVLWCFIFYYNDTDPIVENELLPRYHNADVKPCTSCDIAVVASIQDECSGHSHNTAAREARQLLARDIPST